MERINEEKKALYSVVLSFVKVGKMAEHHGEHQKKFNYIPLLDAVTHQITFESCCCVLHCQTEYIT